MTQERCSMVRLSNVTFWVLIGVLLLFKSGSLSAVESVQEKKAESQDLRPYLSSLRQTPTLILPPQPSPHEVQALLWIMRTIQFHQPDLNITRDNILTTNETAKINSSRELIIISQLERFDSTEFLKQVPRPHFLSGKEKARSLGVSQSKTQRILWIVADQANESIKISNPSPLSIARSGLSAESNFENYIPESFQENAASLFGKQPTIAEIRSAAMLWNWVQVQAKRSPIYPEVHFGIDNEQFWNRRCGVIAVIPETELHLFSELRGAIPIDSFNEFEITTQDSPPLFIHPPSQNLAVLESFQQKNCAVILAMENSSEGLLSHLLDHIHRTRWSGEGNIVLMNSEKAFLVFDTSGRVMQVHYPMHSKTLKDHWKKYRLPIVIVAWLVMTVFLTKLYLGISKSARV
jgi:hypothetical protein